MRGKITEEIEKKAKELLGIDKIETREYRLMPYIQYLATNSENIDPNKINQDERRILTEWRVKGWIGGGCSDLTLSKKFWDAISELIWLGYVNI